MPGRTSRSSGARRKRRPVSHIRHNRGVWNRLSDWYDHRYAGTLGGRNARSWGVFRIPEDDLGLLGPTRGRSILELGCGAGRWSIALAQRGARPTGLDLSAAQLSHARRLQRVVGVRFPLICGSAERLPFRDGSFDIVFCDWGAMTFSDPARSVPECARVLRRGGRFVFATASPFRFMTLDLKRDRHVRRLKRPYFGTYRVDYGGKNDAVEFHPPFGVWVQLFRENGLAIERVVEPRPAPGDRSRYLSSGDVEYARSWPVETIWQLVKE